MHPFNRFMREFAGGTLADAIEWLDRHLASAPEEQRKQWCTWYRPDTRTIIARRYLEAWKLFSIGARGRTCSTEELSRREAFALSLPGPLRYAIGGRPLMVKQAKEVIFATDTLFTRFLEPGLSSDDAWNTWACERLGYDYLRERLKVDGTIYGWRDHCHVLMSLDAVSRQLDHVSLKHLTNSWAAGTGWCHPSGSIRAVGRFDEPFKLGELVLELNSLTNRFGYLDFWLTLFDYENPILTLHADGGLYGPDECYFGGRGTITFFAGSVEPHAAVSPPADVPLERAMPDAWVIECAKLTAPTLWRLVPPRRPPGYWGPGKGWR